MAENPKYILAADDLAKLTNQTVSALLQSFSWEPVHALPGNRVGLRPQVVKAYLSERGVDYTFKVIAHINLKGGPGKTTSATTAATRAAQYGFNTCIVDMDPQASASLAFAMLPEEDEPIFCDVWQHPAEMVNATLKQIEDGLWILPSSLENSLLDMNLINPASQKHAVRGVCKELQALKFDLVMIDCPPSLGTAVISTICASDIVVIPVCSDAFSLKGLDLTLHEINSICEAFHLTPPVIKILYTKFDRRIRLSIEEFDRLRVAYPDYLVPTPIRTSSEFSKVLTRNETIFASTRHSHVKEDYDQYVRHILNIHFL